MSGRWADSWVLVTGASSGLGEELARQLAAKRANLVLSARTTARLESLAAELAARHGVETRVVPMDLSTPDGAARLCDAVDALGIPIDHLVNNAGFGSRMRFIESPVERELSMVRLNCESLLALTHHFLPGMVARRRGGVIQLSSIAGFQPTPFFASYGATKAFVLSLSAALAAEVRGHGVRVMAFCPGPVQTGFQQAAGMPVTDLTKQGLRTRLSLLSAEETVRRGLAAYEQGREVYVPGLVNRLITLAIKVVPRSIVVNAAAKSVAGGVATKEHSA